MPHPYGLCQCGCGQRVNIATRTRTAGGIVKGHPYRFLLGHWPPSYKYQTLLEAFQAQVIQRRDRDCWEARTVGNDGYGRITFRGKHYSAHRVAYTLFVGLVPEGLCVCHTCDRTSCANPLHVFAGTHRDNMQDMVAKGRHGGHKINV